MCRSMEDRINAKAVEFAANLIEKGLMSLEDIAECSNLPLDLIKSLAEKNRPAAT